MLRFYTKSDDVKIYDLRGYRVASIPLAGTRVDVVRIGADVKGVGECLQIVGYVKPSDVRVDADDSEVLSV